MREVTIVKKVFRFSELAPDVQKKLLDKYRDVNVGFDDWWSPIYEEVEEELKKMGFDNADVRFTGFWSQGDGASFTCNNIDVEQYCKHFKLKTKYKTLLTKCKGNISGTIKRDRWHNYVHWNTITVYLDASQGDGASNDKAMQELGKLEEEMQEQVQAFSREIYDRLAEYYDQLTSDEAIKDFIEANYEEFEENGTVY